MPRKDVRAMLPEEIPDYSALTDEELRAGMTDMMQVWANKYLTHWNATRAAKEAGCKGNRNTLRQLGSNLKHDARVRELVRRTLDKYAMSAGEVLARLSQIASGDIGDFLTENEDGTISVDLAKAEEAGVTFLAQRYSVTQRGESIQLYSALEALEKIAKVRAMFKEKPGATVAVQIIVGNMNLDKDI